MPTHKSSAKRMKTAAAARLRNRRVRAAVRAAVKAVQQEKNVEKKKASFIEAVSALDRAAGKGIIHRNKAARTKSRLARRISSR